jgi:hypothetical protein
MSKIAAQVDDLIEETRMRELDDGQVQWRIRKFTQICEREIESGIANMRKRKMLLERLQIMKCLYDHSSVTHPSRPGGPDGEEPTQRIKRLQDIVRRRRLALDMIERVDDRIIAGLEHEYAVPSVDSPVSASRLDNPLPFELNAHHWYFFYFNLFLLCFLICTLLLVIE